MEHLGKGNTKSVPIAAGGGVVSKAAVGDEDVSATVTSPIPLMRISSFRADADFIGTQACESVETDAALSLPRKQPLA